MSVLLFRLVEWLKHYLRADTRFQVHSPIAAQWVEQVLEDKRWYYAFTEIELIRDKLLQNEGMIYMQDNGTGQSGYYRIRDLVGRAASSPKQGRLLFRHVAWQQPRHILEVGVAMGIGGAYLAAGSRNAQYTGLEGCPNCAAVARLNLKLLGIKDSEILEGEFEHTLPIALKQQPGPDCIFLDGNHQYAATMTYFRECLKIAGDNTVILVDDIYHSPAMKKAWKEIRRHPSVRMSIDHYELGVLFFTPKIKSTLHYTLCRTARKPWKKFIL